MSGNPAAILVGYLARLALAWIILFSSPAIGRASAPLHFQEATLFVIRRNVPDSARVSYRELGLNLGMGWTMGLWRAGTALEIADRRYDSDLSGLDYGAVRLRANWNDDGIRARWPGLLEVEGYHYHDRASLLADFLRLWGRA